VTGICGVIQASGTPRSVLAPETLDTMLAVLAHRGPGGVATHVADGVAFGARLRSVDGDQPFASADGTVRCVVDGELYDSGSVEFAAIPELYRRHGERFVERLRGKFAIAVADAESGAGLLVRDRLGIKPLYCAAVGDVVVFASELKSVLASGLIRPELDYEAIDAYLTLGYVPTPRTPLRAVTKLLPGSYLAVDRDGLRVERYWSFPRPTPDVLADERELAERVLVALEESVRLHLRGEDEAAAVLSGGLDSSFIVALLARNTSKPVRTFTVGFAEAGEQNEIAHARYVSEALGAVHHELELSHRDVVDLRQLSWHLDEPLADLSSLGLFAVSGLVGEHASSVFSGQGSDQLFGGYRKHSAASIVGFAKRIPGAITFARAVPARLIPSRFARAAQTIAASDPATRLIAMSGRASPDLRRRLARGELARIGGRAAERAARSRLDGLSDDPLAAALYLDAQLELVDDMLHYFDRATMAHALEVRMPFLDHRFVELTATIPAALKVKRLRNKHVLRLAAEGIVPARVVSDKEKTKIGFFHSAVEGWFRAQLSGVVSEFLLADRLACADFLDQARLQAMVRRHLDGEDVEQTYGLFAILMLEVWLSSYLPRALPHGGSASRAL
jgi:asparagine synthase (glutamine-hydrolysing)